MEKTEHKEAVENTEHTASVQQEESHGSSPLDLFAVDPGLVIWTWITFGLLFLILKKFAWKPLKETVEKRETMLSEAVENAQTVKETMEKIEEEKTRLMNEADRQRLDILQKAKEAAEQVAKDIEEKARNTAGVMVEDARRQISDEKDKAIAELRVEAVDMVIQTSSKLIEETLDDTGHKKLVKRYLEEM